MSLWIESAHQQIVAAGAEGCGDAVGTYQTEEQFSAIVVSGACGEAGGVVSVAQRMVCLVEHGTRLDSAAFNDMLGSLPVGTYAPISMLQVLGGSRAHLVEIDAPPLFLTRGGNLELLPLVEEEQRGHLIRRCEFVVQDGDHMAIVSAGYILAGGWNRRWGWRNIAVSIRRLAATRCSAEQLLGALSRSYGRLAQGEPARDVSILAMFVRPPRSVTVWSGPPADKSQDRAAFDVLMAERGTRVICGDTTAEIAARLMGAELVVERRPEGGWMEVPPMSRLTGASSVHRVDLITEGAVTLRKARERIAGARHVRDLPRVDDSASRLARILLRADVIRFLVGSAINPAQTTDDGVPWRRIVIEELFEELKALGRMVSSQYI